MADLVEVFRHNSAAHAQLIAAALTHHGLHAAVVHDGLASIIGAGSLGVSARVLVPDGEADEARAAIAVLEASADTEPAQGGPSTCPACGAPWEAGFEECWQCQQPG